MLISYRINLLLLLVFFISSISIVSANEDSFQNISLKTTHVRDNIYMLEGQGGFAGGNIGVSIGQDGILIIDDQLDGMLPKIEAALKDLDDGQVKFVLNTHWHGDHSGNNAELSKQATVIAHSNVRNRMMSAQKNHFGVTPTRDKAAWPVITFDHSLTIHFNGEDIEVLHYPTGHTDGDSVIYFTKSNVVHMGDHLFTDVFPFVDITSGGNVFGFAKNIQAVINYLPDDVVVIPGHGALTDKEGLKQYHDMLNQTGTYVRQLAEEGLSLDEIKEKGLPESWKSWGVGFITEEHWITFIYQSL